MRVSADDNDAGYRNYLVAKANGKTVHAYLDGVEVKECLTADSDQGFVLRSVLDADGNIQVDPIDNNMIWVERATGRVEIVIR